MVSILQEGQGTHTIALKALKNLKEVGIKNGHSPLRDIDKKHVKVLAEAQVDVIPAIECVNTSNGYGIIDGRHRVQAAIERGSEDILAHVQFYASEEDVLEAAFRANLTHGKPASALDRDLYIEWLYCSRNLTQEDIAKRVGVSMRTVARAIRASKNNTLGVSPEPSEKTIEAAVKGFYKAWQILYNIAYPSYDTEGTQELCDYLADALLAGIDLDNVPEEISDALLFMSTGTDAAYERVSKN